MFKLVVLSCFLAAANAWTVLLAPSNYRGPLSLAPGQPANVLGSDGRPLDTLDVNLDRSAHFTAKAFEGAGVHLLKKRSVVAPITYSAPFAYAAPLLAPTNYRGPLSLAPGQPANVLGSDGRPLDTLDVNLDRSAHFTAKALEGAGLHLLKKRSVLAPVAYSAPFAYAAPLLAPTNYRGPLSLAPGQPANVLGSDGRPLDTLDVNLDRSAHFTAKALEGAGLHLLKKRSVLAPVAYSAPFAYAAPLLAPTNYRGPLSLAPGQPANVLGSDGRPLDTLEVNLDRSAHYTTKALNGAGIHLLKKRSVVAAAPVLAHAYSTPIAYSAHSIAAPIFTSHAIAPLTYAAPSLIHAW